MDVLDAIRGRRSIRKFKPDPVPEDTLRRIIELATQAPSAGNRQMWRFIAVTNKKVLEEMRDAVARKLDEMMTWPESRSHTDRLEAAKAYSTFFADAPATIVVLGEKYRSTLDEILEGRGVAPESIDALRQRPDIQSVGAAIQNLCLVAHATGYGTCWMSAPCIAGLEIKALLNVQAPWEVIALVPIGFPAEEPSARARNPVEEVLEILR